MESVPTSRRRDLLHVQRAFGFRPASIITLGLMALAVALPGCPKDPEGIDPPIADAGEDFEVPWGQMAVLKGSCTHADPSVRSQLTYRWDMVDWPVSSSLSPQDIEGVDAIDAFFQPDTAGDYAFTFRCAIGPFDSSETISAEALVTATVLERPANRPPTVDAGADLLAEVGDTVVLVADASDPDGDPLQYTWIVIEPAGTNLVDSDKPEARFVPEAAGTYRFLVRVGDGRGAQDEDTIEVTAIEVVRLDGELTVTVIDAHTQAPVEGATVSLFGEDSLDLVGTTDASGQVVLAEIGLAGPVDIRVDSLGHTVSLDHDGDPATPAVVVPRYRSTVLAGMDRSEATVLMVPTAPARETGGRGIVHGCIPQSLFSTLPELERMFSFAGARMGGQLRMVLVAPVPPKESLVDVEVNSFLVPSPHPGVPFPGNMGTDDPFLNDYAGQFGLEPGPCTLGGSAAPFANFVLEAPAGTQRFNVLGGVATLDLLSLLGLLLGATGEGSIAVDIASVLGAIDFTLLVMGFVEVEVPAGGSVDITTLLGNTDSWTAMQHVPHSTARQTAEICDDSGYCEELHQVRVFPATAVTMVPEPPPADPRVAANKPSTSPFEVFCVEAETMVSCDPPRIVDLPAPADTGTDMPYGLDLVFMDLPVGHALAPLGGQAMVGFKFSRAPGFDKGSSMLAVPPLDGAFAGSSYSGVSIAFRRLLSRSTDGAYVFQLGKAADSLGRLVPGSIAEVDPGREVPLLAVDPDNIEVRVLFDVDDPTADEPQVRMAHAMVDGLGAPAPAHLIPDQLPLTLGDEADLVVATFSSVDRISDERGDPAALIPRLTLLLPGNASSVQVPDLSALFSSGDEVRVDVAAYALRGAFAYQQPHDPRLLQRQRAVSSDAWSFRVP